MPRKVFTAGEVLLAADVNTFLSDQTVMTFAGTAARSSAIPTPVEGMLTYLEDSNTYQSWTGSAWEAIVDPATVINPMTTSGDLIVGGTAGSPTRLGVGSESQVLTVVGSNPVWADAAGGGASGLNYVVSSSGTVTLDNGIYRAQRYSYSGAGAGGTLMVNGASITTSSSVYLEVATGSLVLDTRAWTTRTSGFGTTEINALTFGNGVYVAGGNAGQLRTSTDAITWTSRTSGFGTTIIRALTFGNNVYVAAGNNGQIRTSTDGITWTSRTSGTTNTFFALTFGNGLYVAAGTSAFLATSTDAITWTSRTSNIDISLEINALAFGNGVYVAGAQLGELVSSTNGTTWTTRTSNLDWVYSITFGNGLFIAGGSSRVATSTDGITWTSRITGADFSNTVLTFGNNLYVIGSDVGFGSVSTDGITWQGINLNFGGSRINALTFGNGVYVAGGVTGKLSTSTDARGVSSGTAAVIIENFGSPSAI
jgi:hypothetical protein